MKQTTEIDEYFDHINEFIASVNQMIQDGWRPIKMGKKYLTEKIFKLTMSFEREIPESKISSPTNSVGHTLIEENESNLGELAKENPTGIVISDGTVIRADEFPEPPTEQTMPGNWSLRPALD